MRAGDYDEIQLHLGRAHAELASAADVLTGRDTNPLWAGRGEHDPMDLRVMHITLDAGRMIAGLRQDLETYSDLWQDVWEDEDGPDADLAVAEEPKPSMAFWTPEEIAQAQKDAAATDEHRAQRGRVAVAALEDLLLTLERTYPGQISPRQRGDLHDCRAAGWRAVAGYREAHGEGLRV